MQGFEVFTVVMVYIVVVWVMREWSGRWVATIWKKYCLHHEGETDGGDSVFPQYIGSHLCDYMVL